MIKLNGIKINVGGGKVSTYTASSASRALGGVMLPRKLETASAGSSLQMSAAASANTSVTEGYLTGMVSQNDHMLVDAYRDMYYHDSICGSAVDLWSELPFSDIQLYGCPDNILEVYDSAIANLNLRTACAQMTRQYLVDGSYTATLVFDQQSTQFRDQIPYDFKELVIDASPLLSQDPVITAKIGKRFEKFLTSSEPEWEKLRKSIPSKLLESLQNGEYVLDPLSTIHLQRRTFPSEPATSFLKRCLPVYMLEKVLYRGTLFEMSRRQRANVLVTAGDDMWEPTPEELSALANLFQQSDLDPMGALIVTRNSVNVSEFRQSGDFLKWTDVYDQTTSMKLKSLGISDAFLSSEASYSNSESAIAVFMDNLSAYRSFFTHSVFTNKIFPLIAMSKGFYLKGKEKANGLTIKVANDYSQLEIPNVRWSKRLSAQNDENLMEALSSLSEKGVPIPMRLWIAASGLDPENLLSELEEDSKFSDKVKELAPDSAGEDMLGLELSSLSPFRKKSGQFGQLVTSGILSDAYTMGSDGKLHYAFNQKAANEKINRNIAKAVSSLQDPNIYRDALVRGRKASK